MRQPQAPLTSHSQLRFLSAADLGRHQLSALVLIKVQSCHFQIFCSFAPPLHILRNPSGHRNVREKVGACWRGQKKSLDSCFQGRTKSSLMSIKQYRHFLSFYLKHFSLAKPFVCSIISHKGMLAFHSVLCS